MIVQVFAHNRRLITNPNVVTECDHFWPTGGTRLGCVLGDTAKHLQCSQEALDLMKHIKTNRDAIGDIDWWWCYGEKGTPGEKNPQDHLAFSWFGALYRIIDVDGCEAARGFKVYPEHCTIIPNEPTEEMIAAAEQDNPEKWMWKEPFSV